MIKTVEQLMSRVSATTPILAQRGVVRQRNSPKQAPMQPSTCMLGITLVLVSAR